MSFNGDNPGMMETQTLSMSPPNLSHPGGSCGLMLFLVAGDYRPKPDSSHWDSLGISHTK